MESCPPPSRCNPSVVDRTTKLRAGGAPGWTPGSSFSRWDRNQSCGRAVQEALPGVQQGVSPGGEHLSREAGHLGAAERSPRRTCRQEPEGTRRMGAYSPVRTTRVRGLSEAGTGTPGHFNVSISHREQSSRFPERLRKLLQRLSTIT